MGASRSAREFSEGGMHYSMKLSIEKKVPTFQRTFIQL